MVLIISILLSNNYKVALSYSWFAIGNSLLIAGNEG